MDHYRLTSHVPKGTGSPLSFCLLLLVLLITGCGGGGGGGDDADSAQSVQISGAILIPGGTVSTANPIGLKGAANKPVSLYRIDDTGTIIGDVLDTTTSDLDGNYVLLLPANIEYSSDIIVEAEIGPTANDTARAIVLDATTDVTPITEYIAQKLIDDPTLDMSALPLEEVARLIAFVESLPLPPQPDLSNMLTTIATFSNIVVDAQIDDINDPGNQQVRLSGLLSTPGDPGAPRPAPGTAARPIPASNEIVELYRIDINGDNILPAITTIPAIVTTNSEGVFTMELPPGTDVSGDLRLQAIVNTVTIWALVTDEIININAESHYVATKLLAVPFVAPASLDVSEVLGIVQFVSTSNCPEAIDLPSQIANFEACVGTEVDQQIDNAVNDPPTGSTLIIAAIEDITRPIDISGNVSDADGSVDLGTTALVTGPANGILVDNNDGSFSYTGNLDFFGADGFTYTVADNDGLTSAIIGVTINVAADNDAPTGTTQVIGAIEDILLAIDISADVSDVDGTVNLASTTVSDGPASGLLVNNNDGSFTYTGNSDFFGADGFTYTVADNDGLASAPISVTVNVSNVNDAPRGATLVTAAVEDIPTVIDIRGNVADVDGSVDFSTTAISEFPVNGGQLLNNNDGSFTYTGNLDYVGPDAFLFIVDDNDGLTSLPIAVNIDVLADNDAPTGIALVVPAVEETPTPIDISGNVNDVDGTVILSTTSVTGGPTNGNLINNNNGTFSYTGNLDFVGADAFTYTVADDGGQVSANIDVTINVSNLNDAPRGTTLVVAASEETLVAFDVISNVVDIDAGGSVNFSTTTVTAGPTDGNLVNNNDGSFTYTGNLDFVGSDSFTYTVADNLGLVSNGIPVILNVGIVNDPPTGTTLIVAADEETATPIDISGNVSDVDGTVVLTSTAVTGGPANGNLVNNGNGTFSYTGNLDFVGSDAFTYTVTDDGGLTSADIGVTINVSDINDAPTGTLFIAEAIEEAPTLIEISANVSDVDGTVILSTTTVTTAPTSGILVNNGDGSFTYTGNLDFVGTDGFTYTVEDNDGQPSLNIAVTINVNDLNDAPTGTTLVVAAIEETATPIDIIGNVSDVDGTVNLSSTTATGGPANGNLVNNNDGTFTYTGNLDFVGSDGFTYTVEDNDGQVSANIGVTVNVGNANDAPTGTTLVVAAVEEVLRAIDISGNVSDVDGTVNLASTTITNAPANGGLANNGDGSFTYTGNLDFFGSDGFTYTVADNDGLPSNDIAVTINVSNDNDAPRGTTLVVAAVEEIATPIDVTGNVIDVDGTVVFSSIAVTGGPANGNLVNNNDGSFSYTGNLDFAGADGFTYTVADNDSQTSANIGVTINVGNVNDAPTGTTLVVAADEETATPINITGNVTDGDGTVVFSSTTVTGGPANGDLVNNGDGTFTYTGNIDYFGADAFTYTVRDNNNAVSDNISVAINVNDTNDTSPVVDPAGPFAIPENSNNGTSVTTVTASDADTVGTITAYSITAGNIGTAFAIDNSGTLTVLTSAALDRETTSSFTLTINATDSANNVSIGEDFVINLTDLNDTSPVIAPDQTLGIGSSAGNGAVVGQVVATDADTTGAVTGFSITGGNTGNAFAIAANGEITVNDNSTLAANSPYSLTLTATDGTNTSAAEAVGILVSINGGIWNSGTWNDGSTWQ
ncbi:tandem-95 repeat protein [Gammaproteobacteria bacterium]|nr:tandem-95 repeat protein [Gammaproteobacteria bacterium]